MKIPVYKKNSDEYKTENGKKLEKTLNPAWITEDKGLPNEAVAFTEDFGKYLVDPRWDHRNERISAGRNALTTAQLRNFFGEIRRIQMKGFENNITDFYMLKPKLAYSKARVVKEKRDNRIKAFEEALALLIDEVINTENPKHFDNFVKFLEATVAYHKAFGGN